MKYWWLVSVLLLTACKTSEYTLQNGEVVRYKNLRMDKYRWNRMPLYQYATSFQRNNVGSEMHIYLKDRNYEVINTTDIKKLAQEVNKLVVMVWYTCPAISMDQLSLAKAFHSKGYTTLLIAKEYDFKLLNSYLRFAQYPYLSYVMAPQLPHGNNILSNHIDFIKALDPEYHTLHKDDVKDDFCLLLDNQGRIVNKISHQELKQNKQEEFIQRFEGF